MLIVKKYGGSSVSTPEKILEIAKRLKVLKDQGHKLIIIVSAMGDTTDDLVGLSRQITLTPIQREMDMLLSSGERISMALLAIALNSVGCEAISFTGSQSGVFTDGNHNNARIIEIKAHRVREELERGKVVIIAGFQGVNPETKEVTTLGRGGSDTTAVAMAAHFGAERCDILTDVRGIYSIDPRVPGVKPKQFLNLDYELTMEMAYWGARVLHYRSVELAERTGVVVQVHLSSEEGDGTVIHKLEKSDVRAVNYNAQILCLSFKEDYDVSQALGALGEVVHDEKLATPQVVYQRKNGVTYDLFITAAAESFESLIAALGKWADKNKKSKPETNSHFSTVTLTGRGLVNGSTLFQATDILKKNKIEIDSVITSALSLSFIIPQTQLQLASQVLHRTFIEN